MKGITQNQTKKILGISAERLRKCIKDGELIRYKNTGIGIERFMFDSKEVYKLESKLKKNYRRAPVMSRRK